MAGRNERMRVIAVKALSVFWQSEPGAKTALQAWYAEACEADWSKPLDVKARYGNASILKDSRVVFNICGNDYRLVVKLNYPFRTIYIRFVGTHAQYDRINAETI